MADQMRMRRVVAHLHLRATARCQATRTDDTENGLGLLEKALVWRELGGRRAVGWRATKSLGRQRWGCGPSRVCGVDGRCGHFCICGERCRQACVSTRDWPMFPLFVGAGQPTCLPCLALFLLLVLLWSFALTCVALALLPLSLPTPLPPPPPCLFLPTQPRRVSSLSLSARLPAFPMMPFSVPRSRCLHMFLLPCTHARTTLQGRRSRAGAVASSLARHPLGKLVLAHLVGVLLHARPPLANVQVAVVNWCVCVCVCVRVGG